MGWDQAPDTVVRDIKSTIEFFKTAQPQGCLPKPPARDAKTPVQTRLSARRKELEKNTQRRNGVRMRHRRTVARRNRNGRGMGDTPSWRQTADACCYSRALLATFFAAYRAGCRFFPACFAGPAAYHLPLVIRLAAKPSRWPKPAPGARRNGICNRQYCAAPSRRAHGISLKNPTITGHDKPWEGVCPDIETTDAHCFSRALLVALFCTAFVLPRHPESAVRLASSTVVNHIGRIFHGFALKCGLR